MTNENNLTQQDSGLLIKRMTIGAIIGLAVISFFVFGADAPEKWGKYWMIRPLLLTPAAGAVAGAFNHFMDRYRMRGGMVNLLANAAAVVAYIIGIWMGIVLGLKGTMWD